MARPAFLITDDTTIEVQNVVPTVGPDGQWYVGREAGETLIALPEAVVETVLFMATPDPHTRKYPTFAVIKAFLRAKRPNDSVLHADLDRQLRALIEQLVRQKFVHVIGADVLDDETPRHEEEWTKRGFLGDASVGTTNSAPVPTDPGSSANHARSTFGENTSAAFALAIEGRIDDAFALIETLEVNKQYKALASLIAALTLEGHEKEAEAVVADSARFPDVEFLWGEAAVALACKGMMRQAVELIERKVLPEGWDSVRCAMAIDLAESGSADAASEILASVSDSEQRDKTRLWLMWQYAEQGDAERVLRWAVDVESPVTKETAITLLQIAVATKNHKG